MNSGKYFVCAKWLEGEKSAGRPESEKHGCLKYRMGVCVQITYLRSISSYYSMKYWRNW